MDERQRAALGDAMDILNAADLCFLLAVGVSGAPGIGGVFSNMETEWAVRALMSALAATASAPPIEMPRATVQ